MPYRISVGYTDQNGILKTSNFQRTTASVTLNPSLLQDHLTFNINGKFMYAHNRYANGDAIGDATRMDPTQPIYSSDPKYKNYHGYWQWLDSGASLKDENYATMWNRNTVANPLSRLYEKNDRANSYDYMGNIEADYKIPVATGPTVRRIPTMLTGVRRTSTMATAVIPTRGSIT